MTKVSLRKYRARSKRTLFISSSLSLAKLARLQSSGRGKYLSSSGLPQFRFHLFWEAFRPPNRGRGGKWPQGGRGVSPPKSKRGFWKWESYSCLPLTDGCLSLQWQAWRDRGADPWVVEVLLEGCPIPFLSVPPLSSEPIPMPLYSPTSTKGKSLEEVNLSLVQKGAVELAPLPSPGYYSRLFVVWKTSDLSLSFGLLCQ